MYNMHNIFNKITFYTLHRISIYWIVVSHLSPTFSVFGTSGFEIQKERIEYFAASRMPETVDTMGKADFCRGSKLWRKFHK